MIKSDKMVKRSPFGNIRKRLSDITNMHSQHKSPSKEKENVIPVFDNSNTKNYIEQILQENATMMKLIQERDKFIEATGIEMQKMRLIVQKLQLQNLHLAQSNSQMLAELNVGKDRLKALQHELACKDALLKAKIVEQEKKAKMKCQTNGLQKKEAKSEEETADHSLQANINNENKEPKNKRGRPTRSRSMGPTESQQAADKEMAENKRRCLRRQSVRLKSQQEPQVELFEIDVVKVPISREPMDEPLLESNSDRAGDKEVIQRSSKIPESQRISIGRPLRRAAVKVQSYKEPPLNVKVRRPE